METEPRRIKNIDGVRCKREKTIAALMGRDEVKEYFVGEMGDDKKNVKVMIAKNGDKYDVTVDYIGDEAPSRNAFIDFALHHFDATATIQDVLGTVERYVTRRHLAVGQDFFASRAEAAMADRTVVEQGPTGVIGKVLGIILEEVEEGTTTEPDVALAEAAGQVPP